MKERAISFSELSYASLYKILNNVFTREELRTFAREHFIPRGQNKADTIKNIINTDPEPELRIHGLQI